MAEPVRYTTLEADAGGLPSFSSPGNIFDVPNTLLGGFPIGADTGYGTLLGGSSPFSGVGVTFAPPATSVSFGPSGSMIGGNLSLGDMLNPWNVRTDITQLAPNWGTWNPNATTTAGDMSGVTLGQTPYRNIGIDQGVMTGGNAPVTTTSNITNTATSGVVTMDPYRVNESTLGQGPNFILDANQYINQPVTGGNALLGGVATTAPGVTVMDPFQVTASRLPAATLNLSQTPSTTTGGDTGAGGGDGVTQLPPVTVTGTRVTTPTMSSEDMRKLLDQATAAWGTQPVTLPPVIAEKTGQTVNPLPVTTSVPTITPPSTSVIVPPAVTVPTQTTPTTTTPTAITPTLPVTPAITQTGTATPPSTTSTSSAMTQRDIAAELAKTLPALQQNQAAIQKMYGDLYSQFMPKGISQTEQGLINQYQTDLARLQQRQAGVLAPEDIRQSQQAAREAYGARGQVMAPGAIGAEILNREAIRQQREDQARAALQSSYGNILNMANIQTGNLFSPIASLMSGTFNPLGAYPADVYGTNVNAQLAREIAQKNYEAAVKSAELSGAAAKQAATTSATGSIFGPALGAAATKGISAIFTVIGVPPLSCMPGDQCIDTPTGPKAVKDLKGGDQVIGYDGEVAYIAQACSWNQDPLRTFLTITREDGSSFTVCDDHKVMGIPAMEWVEGADLAGSKITSIKPSTGLLTSYDILTNQGGYRINGIPVNSMIPEIIMQVVEFHRQVDRNLQAASA